MDPQDLNLSLKQGFGHCGYEINYLAMKAERPEVRTRDPMAMTSFVSGLVSLIMYLALILYVVVLQKPAREPTAIDLLIFCASVLVPLVPIATGILALLRNGSQSSHARGKRMASIGILIGITELGLSIFVF